jgi:hypothetical protein
MAKITRRVGRPALYESQQELYEYFMEYIDDCSNEKKIANMAGFRRHQMISRSALFELEKKDEYKDALELMQDILEDETLNNTEIDSITRRMICESKFGYSTRINAKVDSSSIVKSATYTAEEIEQLRAELLPD